MGEPFRTQIPNIIDDLGLDPFERALYVHYKRTCGENPQGYSNETTETIRKKLKMSAGQVSQARKTLAERGFIRMQDTRPVVVTVVDIWDLNHIYYQLEREQRPDIDGWTVGRLQLWSSDVHTVNVNGNNSGNLCSPSETNTPDVHHMNEKLEDVHMVKLNDNMSTYIHPVKQRIESINRESNKERESRPRDKPGPLALSLARICLINLDTVTNGAKKKYFDALNILIDTKATAEQVKGFGEWWKTNWRGKNGSPPLPNQVCDLWGEFQAGYQPKKVSISAK